MTREEEFAEFQRQRIEALEGSLRDLKSRINQRVIEELEKLSENFYTDRYDDDYVERTDLKDRIEELKQD